VIVNQLLNPALEDQLANNVGTLVVQLVFSCGAQLGEANLKELIKAGQSLLSAQPLFTHLSHSPSSSVASFLMIQSFNHLSIELCCPMAGL
jgi:hypothetical protein